MGTLVVETCDEDIRMICDHAVVEERSGETVESLIRISFSIPNSTNGKICNPMHSQQRLGLTTEIRIHIARAICLIKYLSVLAAFAAGSGTLRCVKIRDHNSKGRPAYILVDPFVGYLELRLRVSGLRQRVSRDENQQRRRSTSFDPPKCSRNVRYTTILWVCFRFPVPLRFALDLK